MKQGEMASWLRGLVLFSGAAGLLFMLGIVPPLVGELAGQYPSLAYLAWPGLTFFWITAIPAAVALCKVWQICGEIGKNNSFCAKNAALLRDVSRLCLLDSFLYLCAVAAMAFARHFDIFVLLLLFGAILLGVFLAVLTAALSHLTEKASLLKRENDLTI